MRKQIHTDCTCTAFLLNAFSCVPSNGLHQLMHSHSVHIWRTFPRCASFHALWDFATESTYSYTEHIWRVFLLCVFASGLLNDVNGKKNNCNNHICLIFFHFQHLFLNRDLCWYPPSFPPSFFFFCTVVPAANDHQRMIASIFTKKVKLAFQDQGRQEFFSGNCSK